MLTIWRGALLNFVTGMFISYVCSRENYSNNSKEKCLKAFYKVS